MAILKTVLQSWIKIQIIMQTLVLALLYPSLSLEECFSRWYSGLLSAAHFPAQHLLICNTHLTGCQLK